MSTEGDFPVGGARGVVREINERLRRIDARLSTHEELLAERARLLAARAALTGEATVKRELAKRVSQDDIAAYLAEHPGSWPAEIAQSLGVPVTNVSQHLYRGKQTRFDRQEDGWHVHSRAGSQATNARRKT
jgi:DNA-directed RNA polymerase specialized sigma24 family protein